MARPTLSRQTINRLGGDRGVEFAFGKEGSANYFRDTLWEDWASRPQAEQTAEMNRRYDTWLTLQQMVTAPVEPTIDELRAQLATAEQDVRNAQRQVLDLQDQIYVMEQQEASVEADSETT